MESQFMFLLYLQLPYKSARYGGLTVDKAKINTIEEALDDIAKGRMVILVDDEDRENEGDLCMAAEKVTAEAINFMAKYGRGLICLSLTPQKAEDLGSNDGGRQYSDIRNRVHCIR